METPIPEIAVLLQEIRQLQTQVHEMKANSAPQSSADRVMGTAGQHRAPDDMSEDGEGEYWYDDEPTSWEAVLPKAVLTPSVPAAAQLLPMMHSPPALDKLRALEPGVPRYDGVPPTPQVDATDWTHPFSQYRPR